MNRFKNFSVLTKHIYRDPLWVHLISAEPVAAELEKALLHAQSILRAQYGKYSHKCIQLSTYTGAEVLETEAGVGLISWEDVVSVPSETVESIYLVTNEVHKAFQKSNADPEDFREFDELLGTFWEHYGLVYAFCHPSEVVIL